MAQNDEEYGEDATEFICECYGELKDSVKWLQSLKDGLVKYPTKDYYYNKLLNYYNIKNDMGAMEEFVQDMKEVKLHYSNVFQNVDLQILIKKYMLLLI